MMLAVIVVFLVGASLIGGAGIIAKIDPPFLKVDPYAALTVLFGVMLIGADAVFVAAYGAYRLLFG